jgi:hypothetical protein
MSDSKISQLPLSPHILDSDLMVVVTGSLDRGTYPQTCRIPMSYVRRFITRLNLLINVVSGLAYSYNSGLNILTLGLDIKTANLLNGEFASNHPYNYTIYNTGLNARTGNNIEISFNSNSAAANKYGGAGGKYQSGIISTTGLNAKTENLIRLQFENSWPHSGVIYTTGLNARAGNHIEIDFSTNRHNSAGAPYYSGIISTTGLNASPGKDIYLKVSNSWPHQNEIGFLENYYESAVPLTVPIEGSSVDEKLMFPLLFPTGINSLVYSKWKCEGYYQNITITTTLPATQPSVSGPNGEPVTWLNYVVTDINQGRLIPSLYNFTYLLSNNTTKNYENPVYTYTDNTIYTQHTSLGTKSHGVDNVHFLAFFNKPEGADNGFSNPSGTVGFRLIAPWYSPATCSLWWNGIYYINNTSYAITASISATGYVNSITINGHRFIEVKPII